MTRVFWACSAICVVSLGIAAAPQGPAVRADSVADGTTALHQAVHRNDVAAVETLIRGGADVRATTRYGITPLHLACVNGHAVIVDRLLAAGADPNSALPDGETALMTAARTGDVATVQALLARGANHRASEPSKGQTALMWAAAENN